MNHWKMSKEQLEEWHELLEPHAQLGGNIETVIEQIEDILNQMQ